MLVKEKWTNKDFSKMSWHDSRIYQIKFPDEKYNLTLYIDYIFKWERGEDGLFKFWVSPCELIFKNVFDLKLNILFEKAIGIDIEQIKREKIGLTPNAKMTDWKFLIETDRGNIELLATDFQMTVISQPKLLDTQDMSGK